MKIPGTNNNYVKYAIMSKVRSIGFHYSPWQALYCEEYAVNVVHTLASEEVVSSPASHMWSTKRQSSAPGPYIGLMHLKVEETTDRGVVLHS